MKVLTTFCALVCSLNAFGKSPLPSSFRSPASINRGAQALATPSRLLYNGETLISADLIENYKRMQAEKNDLKISDFIPLTLAPSDNTTYVFSAIADQSLSTMMNQPAFRESTFGKAATSVEKNLKKEVILSQAHAPNEISHKLDFQLQAFQTKAQVKYEGLTKAALSYQVRDSVMAVEVYERLQSAKEVVLSHEMRPEQRLSSVSVRWGW